ncbi:hypothetical protein [Actinoallomurus sp. NPDC052274]|uniref:hypothetical protein n=1 Tax=Actinoallomurus sp. NPDC052274 TaxID=3155420 RepID=UPI00341F7306
MLFAPDVVPEFRFPDGVVVELDPLLLDPDDPLLPLLDPLECVAVGFGVDDLDGVGFLATLTGEEAELWIDPEKAYADTVTVPPVVNLDETVTVRSTFSPEESTVPSLQSPPAAMVQRALMEPGSAPRLNLTSSTGVFSL